MHRGAWAGKTRPPRHPMEERVDRNSVLAWWVPIGAILLLTGCTLSPSRYGPSPSGQQRPLHTSAPWPVAPPSAIDGKDGRSGDPLLMEVQGLVQQSQRQWGEGRS